MTDASPLVRKSWMATLAKAPPARLAALFPDLPPHHVLRQPEIGAVMVRGRVGGQRRNGGAEDQCQSREMDGRGHGVDGEGRAGVETCPDAGEVAGGL